jgi:hypothetical protein
MSGVAKTSSITPSTCFRSDRSTILTSWFGGTPSKNSARESASGSSDIAGDVSGVGSTISIHSAPDDEVTAVARDPRQVLQARIGSANGSSGAASCVDHIEAEIQARRVEARAT